MATPPTSTKTSLGQRLNDHARAHWPAMRERARQHVADRHDWAQGVGRYAGVYQHLIARRAAVEQRSAA